MGGVAKIENKVCYVILATTAILFKFGKLSYLPVCHLEPGTGTYQTLCAESGSGTLVSILKNNTIY
jgi:hypothetical protein